MYLELKAAGFFGVQGMFDFSMQLAAGASCHIFTSLTHLRRTFQAREGLGFRGLGLVCIELLSVSCGLNLQDGIRHG